MKSLFPLPKGPTDPNNPDRRAALFWALLPQLLAQLDAQFEAEFELLNTQREYAAHQQYVQHGNTTNTVLKRCKKIFLNIFLHHSLKTSRELMVGQLEKSISQMTPFVFSQDLLYNKRLPDQLNSWGTQTNVAKYHKHGQ
ncbi:MAG: hypothetical protein J6J82_00490 [Alphaproteobacteria bacterium]|nr:hypothetical protein [Alphaproteobacteria bacterium]